MTPWWVPVVVAVIALIGIVVNNVVLRSSHRQHRLQWEREQVALEARIVLAREDDERKNKRALAVDIYKWATAMSVSDNPREAETGVKALKGLLKGRLLDPDMEELVVIAARSTFQEEQQALESAAAQGLDVRVIQVGLDDSVAGDVPLILVEDPDFGLTNDGGA